MSVAHCLLAEQLLLEEFVELQQRRQQQLDFVAAVEQLEVVVAVVHQLGLVDRMDKVADGRAALAEDRTVDLVAFVLVDIQDKENIPLDQVVHLLAVDIVLELVVADIAGIVDTDLEERQVEHDDRLLVVDKAADLAVVVRADGRTCILADKEADSVADILDNEDKVLVVDTAVVEYFAAAVVVEPIERMEGLVVEHFVQDYRVVVH